MFDLRTARRPRSSSGGEPKTRGRSRRRGLLATITATVFAAALIAAPGAGAVVFQNTGSSIEDTEMIPPEQIAVDPSNNNVYVASRISDVSTDPVTPGRIYRYDEVGTPLSPPSMGEAFYWGVAVEQGGDHTVYAYSRSIYGGPAYIEAFDNSGSPLGAPFPFEVDQAEGQLASDPEGNVYLPDSTTNTVKKYTSAMVAGTPAEFACTGTDCNSTALNEPVSADVDAAGNLYVADMGNSRVVKFKPDGSYDSIFYEGNSQRVSVAPASGTVLVLGNDGSGFHVTALDSSGNVVGEIPTTEFEGAVFVGMGINKTTETVYVGQYTGTSEVKIYQMLVPPTVTTDPASGVSSTGAVLNGTVNPKGVINEDCRFEYTDDADFQANEWANAVSVPCEPEPFNEETDVAVSAEVSGLSPETTYDYRVVETTEGGTTEGAAVQFTTTAPAPTVTTEAAGGISQTAATLNGKVDAEGNDAECKFEYGTSTAYGKSIACSVNPVTGSTATAVSAALSGLSAGTTYHYRVVAENGGGTTPGADMSFATLADTCATNAALCPPPPPPPVTPPPTEAPGDNRNEAAYKVCVKKANKAYAKAKAKAKTAAAKKAAKKKKVKAIKKCKAKYL